jgi:diguanylate cyclase (GGDEF)-like protein/PAS domain S-box-containing protein
MAAAERILIVDDDRAMLRTLQDVLAFHGYAVTAAGSGTEAVRAAGGGDYHLALVDLRLQDMSGLEVIERLKALHPDLQAIIITGHASLGSAIEATNTGVFCYLLKPCAADHLLLMIRRALEKRAAAEALRRSEARYRELFDHASDIVFTCSHDGTVTSMNRAGLTLLGIEAEELPSVDLCARLAPGIPQGQTLRELAASNQRRAEVLYHRPNGEAVWLDIALRVGPDEIQGIARDVTSQKRFQERLEYLGLHDVLTGLHNRAHFEAVMQELEAEQVAPVTIVSTDFDGLKLINDTMGHQRGDEALQTYAAILKAAFRKGDTVARVGGDEFAVILPSTEESEAEVLLDRVRETVERYGEDNPDLPFSVSLGMATGRPGEPLTDVYRRADDDLYREKLQHRASARNRVVKALVAALAERDYVAQGHVRRLSAHVDRLGDAAGINGRQRSNLKLLAEVHDLGKVGIPDSILFKPDRLTREERLIIERHSEIGYRIALASADLAPVAELILHHHEWWDGGGYPLGLQGEQIPIECRILTIVDAFDAMTSERPYSRGRSAAEALAELERCAGTQFDPVLVAKFVELVRSGVVEAGS